MNKTFRPYTPGQSFLLPPSPLIGYPRAHLARFILDLVKELDLSRIYEHYKELARIPRRITR